MSRIDNYTPLLAVAVVFTIAIVVVFQLILIQEPERLEAEANADFVASVIEGNALYGANCAVCHGEKGEGAVGPSLRTKELLQRSKGQLVEFIKIGAPSMGMPAWSQAYGGPFTDEDAHNVVAFLTTWVPLEPDATEDLPAGEAPSEPQGSASTLYAANCAACHGPDGEGGIGPPLQSNAFVRDQTDEALIEFVLSGRSGTAMPGFEGKLPLEDIRTIITLLRDWE